MKKYVFIILLCIVIVLSAHIPFTYITPNYSISKEAIGYNLSKGFMGLKVYVVMKRLNIETDYIKYDDELESAVKTFQQTNNLEVTGIVDLTTWKALGFSEEQWYDLEYHVTPCLVSEESTYEERIQAMITTAKSYIGTLFVDGASGDIGEGVDCSGLMMQVMYSAGIDPKPISPIRHSYPKYEYESYSLWAHNNIRHYPYYNRLPGDLVFFCNDKGRVNHVGIYIGNNQIIEATRKYGVKITSIKDTSKIKCVGRIIKAE